MSESMKRNLLCKENNYITTTAESQMNYIITFSSILYIANNQYVGVVKTLTESSLSFAI